MDLYRTKLIWTYVIHSYSAQAIEILGTAFIQFTFFYVPVLCYSALSIFAPKFARRHQLQPKEKPISREDAIKCFYVVISNQTLALAFHMSMLGLQGKPNYRIEEKLPSWKEIIPSVVACMLMREVGGKQSGHGWSREDSLDIRYSSITLIVYCTARRSTHKYTSSTTSLRHLSL